MTCWEPQLENNRKLGQPGLPDVPLGLNACHNRFSCSDLERFTFLDSFDLPFLSIQK